MTPSDRKIVDAILLHEGEVYTNDPLDAGGPTKFGITLDTLSRHRGHAVSADDVRALSRDEAAEIYEQRYIRPFDGLPIGLRENVIDMGVNAGLSRATKLLQQLVGADVDGALGPQTIRLAMNGDWNTGYCYMRLAFYEHLIENKPSQKRFRNGWRKRALSFLRDA